MCLLSSRSLSELFSPRRRAWRPLGLSYLRGDGLKPVSCTRVCRGARSDMSMWLRYPHWLGRKAVWYACTAVLCLGLDLLRWLSSGVMQVWWVVLALVLAVGACLLARFPRAAGCVLLAAYVVAISTDFAGLVMVCGLLAPVDWLSRGWLVAGMLPLGVAPVIEVIRDGPRVLPVVIFLEVACLATGLACYSYERRLADARRREGELRARLTDVNREILEQIAVVLHDTVATELSHVIVRSRLLVARSAGRPQELAEGVLVSASRALEDLGLVMRSRRCTGPSGAGLSWAAVLAEGRDLLSLRHLALQADVKGLERLEDALSPGELDLAQVCLREGLVNAAKYAADASQVRVTTTCQPSACVMEVRSVLPPAVRRGPREGTGFGLDGLAARARLVGAELSCGAVGGMWVVSVVFPAQRERMGGRGEVET